tara:strand:- start:1138 stop:1431 length:294 start_codon:yes stop_codon:yes gene_type:complete
MKKIYNFIFLSNIKLYESMNYKAELIAESELPHNLKIVYVWCICQIQILSRLLNNFLIFIDDKFVLNNLISLQEIKDFGIDLERNQNFRKKYEEEIE